MLSSAPPSARAPTQLLDLAFDGEDADEDPMAMTGASVADADASVRLMEATDPELFNAGVLEHACRLGMDPQRDQEFLWIARESLVAFLPEGWYHVSATETGEPYYYNEITGESRWDHPCDEQFRRMFNDLKQRKYGRQYENSSPNAANASYFGSETSRSTYQAWHEAQEVPRSGRQDGLDNRSSDYANYSPRQENWSSYNQPTAATGSYYADAYASSSYKNEAATYNSDYESDGQSYPVQRGTARSRASAASPRPGYDREEIAARDLRLEYAQKIQKLEEMRLQDETKIQELRQENQHIADQFHIQAEELQAHKDASIQLAQTVNTYDMQLQDSKKAMSELTEANATLKKELIATRNRLEQSNDSSEQKDAMTEELNALKQQVVKEISAREDIEQKYKLISQTQSRLTKELEDLHSTNRELDEKIIEHERQRTIEVEQETEGATNASSEAMATIQSLREELQKKDQEVGAMQSKMQKLLDDIESLRMNRQSELDSINSVESDLQRQIAMKDEDLIAQRQEIVQLNESCDATLRDKQAMQNQLEANIQLLTNKIADAEEQHRAQKRDIRSMERDLKAAQTHVKERDEELAILRRSLENAELKLDEQSRLADQARQKGREEAEIACAEEIRNALAEKTKVAELYAQELQTRRKLHNRLMELQGNIRVFCRVRPIQPVEFKSDQATPAVFFRENDGSSLDLVVGEVNGDGKANVIGQKHSFEFDHIFQPSSTQSQVFEQTRALVVSALDGFNVCIFAYGQTGSGKTHTMEGTEQDRGVNFRALQELFTIRDERIASGNLECTMKLSILEVYNEAIVDLLESMNSPAQAPGGAATKGLEVRMGKSGVYVDNLMEVEVSTEQDVKNLMKIGHSHRSVGSHDFNEHSSRSHLVLSINIETLNKGETRRRTSKLHLIDLAGSERVSKTAASGQRLKEAQNINRSLSALGDVIAALGSNSKHVPYRNSKLTFLLQESLSGNSKVLMFVNVSPVQWNAWETLCSLNFASRCRNVALGVAKANTSSATGGGVAVAPLSSSASSNPPSTSSSMHTTMSMSSMTNGPASAVRANALARATPTKTGPRSQMPQ